MDTNELRDFLESRADFYNRPSFITDDPISIPHLFTKKEDIEIAGFLSATIAWGNRKTILNNARRLMAMMDDSPHAFILHAGPSDFRPFLNFVHRTFNGDDCLFYITSLQNIYRAGDSLETLFGDFSEAGALNGIMNFRTRFLSCEHLVRSEKHVANPAAGSAAKRMNMYLRWMVRSDDHGVDFGIWKKINPASLICPLDVHAGRVARQLGLLKRDQNDWKAAVELTENLRSFDPMDPVKYDFALFGLGVATSRGISQYSSTLPSL